MSQDNCESFKVEHNDAEAKITKRVKLSIGNT